MRFDGDFGAGADGGREKQIPFGNDNKGNDNKGNDDQVWGAVGPWFLLRVPPSPLGVGG